MSEHLVHEPEEPRSGEPIRFAASSRAEAESLQRRLKGFGSRLERANGTWFVEIVPDRRAAPLLLHLFQSISEWLHENGLASVEVSFGESRFTLLHPSTARSSHSAEFLLWRIVQLETALESRVTIERATGLLAGRLHLTLDEAFEVLRHAARGAGRQLHDLADEVVGAGGELPREVRNSLETRLRRKRG